MSVVKPNFVAFENFNQKIKVKQDSLISQFTSWALGPWANLEAARFQATREEWQITASRIWALGNMAQYVFVLQKKINKFIQNIFLLF